MADGDASDGESGRSLVLPEVPHLPGRTPRPPDALFAPLKAGLSAAMSPEKLVASAAFREGLKAFDADYFWEAHELWEAVWMCLPPASAERCLLQGLIQLANGGLKRRMGRPGAAARIFALADAALAEAFGRGGAVVMGMDRPKLKAMRDHADHLSNALYCIKL